MSVGLDRASFLAGQSWITVEEARAWARELNPCVALPPLPPGLDPRARLTVQVDQEPPHSRSGFTGATVLFGPMGGPDQR